MDRERFEELVEEALEDLPAEFARRLDNVDVVTAAMPSRRTRREMGLGPRDTLLGLYRGVPQTERDTRYGNVLPDQIVIYREPVLDEADAVCPPDAPDDEFEAVVRDVIRKTVLHEVGHHFGLTDADLRRLQFE